MKSTPPVILKKGNPLTDIDFEQGVAILIDKPGGMTSFGVVSRLRRLIKIAKVGHAGTLDPSATGLLILLTGRATRTQSQFMGLDKEYIATILMGTETNTWDMDGAITAELTAPELEIDNFSIVLAENFTGEFDQVPPIFSAIKVKGVPSYRRARRGQDFTLKPRRVQVHDIEIMGWHWPEVTLRVHCSSGFYVRSLAHDLGKIVGCGGTLKRLQRTRIGNYCLDEAFTLDDLTEYYTNVRID